MWHYAATDTHHREYAQNSSSISVLFELPWRKMACHGMFKFHLLPNMAYLVKSLEKLICSCGHVPLLDSRIPDENCVGPVPRWGLATIPGWIQPFMTKTACFPATLKIRCPPGAPPTDPKAGATAGSTLESSTPPRSQRLAPSST